MGNYANIRIINFILNIFQIDLKTNPLNLYQVLYQRGIGTQCSQFYIGWAHYYDAANAFKQAESVYNLGFQAKAQPFRDLEDAHKNFRLSIAQRMLYDDSQSKKRTASHLTDQRQQITTLKPTTTSSSTIAATGAVVHPQTTYLQSSPVEPTMEPPGKKFRGDGVEPVCNESSVSQYSGQATANSGSISDGYGSRETVNTSSYGTNNSTACAISSSLNSVYGVNDQTAVTYTFDLDENALSEHEDAASFILNTSICLSETDEVHCVEGINIPPNFCRSAKNHQEPWMGALFLEEFDTNKVCKYPRHLVYPGNGMEYSLEEIRARKYASIIAEVKERARQREFAAVEQERAKIQAQQEEEQRLKAELERQQRARAVEAERQRAIEQERLRLAEQQRQQQQQQQLHQQQYYKHEMQPTANGTMTGTHSLLFELFITQYLLHPCVHFTLYIVHSS